MIRKKGGEDREQQLERENTQEEDEILGGWSGGGLFTDQTV